MKRNKTLFDYDYKYNADDYFKDLKADYSQSDILDMFAVDNIDNISDDDIAQSFYDQLEHEYRCASEMLDILLDNDIITLGQIGTWRGSFLGYKELGNNLNEILNDLGCDYFRIYSNGYNIRFEGCHHDGTNHILFRKWRKGITSQQKDRFEAHIINKTLTNRIINYYTESLLPYVAKFYDF